MPGSKQREAYAIDYRGLLPSFTFDFASVDMHVVTRPNNNNNNENLV